MLYLLSINIMEWTMSKNKPEKESSVIANKELWGMIVVLFSFIILFCLFTGGKIFYPIGYYVQSWILGAMGFFSYPLFLFWLFYGIMMIVGGKSENRKSVKIALALIIFLIATFGILHLCLSPIGELSFSEYVVNCFNSPLSGIWSSTFGGALFAMINFGLIKAISITGTYVVYGVIFALLLLIGLSAMPKREKVAKPESEDLRQERVIEEEKPEEKSTPIPEPKNVTNVYYNGNQSPLGGAVPPLFTSGGSNVRDRNRLVIGGGKFEMKGVEDYEQPVKRQTSPSPINSSAEFNYSDEYQNGVNGKVGYSKQSKTITPEKPTKSEPRYGKKEENLKNEEVVADIPQDEKVYIPKNFKDAKQEQIKRLEEDYNVQNVNASDDSFVDMSKVLEEPLAFSQPNVNDAVNEEKPKPSVGFNSPIRKPEIVKPEPHRPERPFGDKDVKLEKPEQLQFSDNPIDNMPLNYRYLAPPSSMLKSYPSNVNFDDLQRFNAERSESIIQMYKDLGNIDVQVVNIVNGPTVSRFDIEIPSKVSINAIKKYTGDLKFRLKVDQDVRVAQVKGTSRLGIEVPNDSKQIVGLKDIIESSVFQNAKKKSLTFAIGKSTVGDPIVADITAMPHLLIAGSTGTGKSVGLNALLASLIMKYTPQDMRLIIVDPKMVEFTAYEHIPHLLFDEIIYDADKAVAMLNWAVKEMDDRYDKLRQAYVQKIDDYNAQIDTTKVPKMYRLVIIIDEFADLMSKNKREIEEKIQRLAQKARAAGIYLILATQRPTVDIISGAIKTNISSRIAFKMTTAIDSNTVLDESGAEALLGKGDLLYKVADMPATERAQGALIEMDDLKKVLNYVRDNNKAYFNNAALMAINKELEPQIEAVTGKDDKSASSGGMSREYVETLRMIIERCESDPDANISITQIQVMGGFGYPKAAKINEMLTRLGYIVNVNGKKRSAITMKEFEEEFNETN